MSTTLKQLALRFLPAPAMRYVRARHYRQSLRTYDIHAEPDLLGCRALIQPGDTVLDIGGNIGVYTRFCAEFVGPTGHVYALEPVPETFSYLQGNVRALGLRNVDCLNVAASDHDSDDGRMFVPEYTTGGANLYESSLSSEGNVQVRTARLDTLFPELRPSFLKIDVEGHEIACIQGAEQLLRRSHPVLLIEVAHEEIFPLLGSLGYRAFWYDAGSFRPRSEGAKHTNYFFFPEGQEPPLSQGAALP